LYLETELKNETSKHLMCL